MSEKVTKAGFHAPKVRAFLAAIRVMPHIGRAAKAAGIRPGMHYRRIKTDLVYKAAFDEAWEIGIGAVEDDAVERAVIGYKEPLVYQGRFSYAKYTKKGVGIGEPLYILRPNPTMHLAVLRAAKPEKWSHRHEVTGKDGGPIEGNITITFVKAK